MKRTEIARIVGDLITIEEHKGTTYVTDGFWLAPATVVAPLLEWWNLDLEPGIYTHHCGKPVRFDEPIKEPKIGGLIKKYIGQGDPVQPRLIGSTAYTFPMCVALLSEWCAVFDTGERPVVFRVDYLRLAFGEDWTQRKFRQVGPEAPLTAEDPIGAVMPVRLAT